MLVPKTEEMTGYWKKLCKDYRNILIILQQNFTHHVKENEKAGRALRVSEIGWKWHHVKKQARSVCNASDLYSKGARFECRLWFRM